MRLPTHPPTPWDLVYQGNLRYVTRLARRLAKGDSDLAADLAQEAWFAILKAPQRRWSQGKYIHTIIFRAMQRYCDREAAQRGGLMKQKRRRSQHRGREISVIPLHSHEKFPHPPLDADQPPLRLAA